MPTEPRKAALLAAETRVLESRRLIRDLAGLVGELLDHGLVPGAREAQARTLVERAGVFSE